MANRDQKAVPESFHEVARATFERNRDYKDPKYGENFTVIVEQGDLHEGRSNRTYQGGAYRVSSPEGACRKKTFLGESAWSNAQRYANDACTALTAGVGAVFAFSL